MIEAVIVGLLTTIGVMLFDIRKELVRFRVHFDEGSLNGYDRRNMIETIGSMDDTLREIRINTGRG